MIVIELIEELILPIVLMIYVSGIAIAIHKIRKRITGSPIDQFSSDGQLRATHDGHQEAVILSNQ